MKIRGWILLCVVVASSICVFGQEDKKTKKDEGYAQFIENTLKADEGLFMLYTKKGKLFFEIPDDVLNKDMLMGARVAEISDPNKVVAGEMRKAPVLIQFSRDNDKVYLKQIVSDYIVNDEEDISKSVYRNSITPILHTFPIQHFNMDSTAVVIDVTKFFSEEIKAVSPFNKKFKAGKLNSEATQIEESFSFLKNVEIRTLMSYESTTGKPFLILMHRSILLLPEEPMQARFLDDRIGYFATSQILFKSDEIGAQSRKYIQRFDIKPRPEDIDKFRQGELVQPEKQIVFYIDDAFPKEWIPFIKSGIEDWQKAFEAIGFKNAIVAKVYPQNDPEFNPEDLRYSCIRYVSIAKDNAMGPRWIDPRSGEIICGDVLWWHDVVVRLRNWKFVQCAQVEPLAREENTSLELLGDMIRYVIAHEVGHTLGLKHNMRASYAYPVDSLRSATFTQQYGTTPSIMDYARFNYIAQPGDTGVRLLPPHLGLYDYLSIKYGYQYIWDAQSPDDEKQMLNGWILENKDDPRYLYGEQQMTICFDPASQAEALGDDAIKGSTYGVSNLKYIMERLVEWTTTENEDYKFLTEIYGEITKQFNRYLGHVNSYLGGAYSYIGVEGENIPLFTPVSKQKQKEALTWIMNELQDQPSWFLNADIEERLGSQKNKLFKDQAKMLDNLMSAVIFQRLILYHNDYSAMEYLNDLHDLLWEKALTGKALNEFERNLQISYIYNLKSMVGIQSSKSSESSLTNEYGIMSTKSSKISYVDNLVKPLVLQKIDETETLVKKLLKTKNKELKAHYSYLLHILN